jgi:hypothetical protein
VGRFRKQTGDSARNLLIMPAQGERLQPPAQLVASAGGIWLVARPAAAITFGEGWLPEESWGRWIVARRAVIFLRPRLTACRLRLEYSALDAMDTPQEFSISLDDADPLEPIQVDGLPWSWRSLEFPLPAGTRSVTFHLRRLYRSPQDGRFFGLPIRHLVLAD